MFEPMVALLAPILGYALGAVPFALLIGAMAGVDLRVEGSRNIGAGNLTRLTGLHYGVAAAVLDGLKGLVPVLVARRLGATDGIAVAAGIGAIVGHNWSIYLRGRAGRGLATASGVLMAVAPVLLLWAGLWAVAGWRIGGGLGSFFGWIMLGPVTAFTSQPGVVVTATLLISLIVLVRRIQGNHDAPGGARAAFERAVWDTDRLPVAIGERAY